MKDVVLLTWMREDDWLPMAAGVRFYHGYLYILVDPQEAKQELKLKRNCITDKVSTQYLNRTHTTLQKPYQCKNSINVGRSHTKQKWNQCRYVLSTKEKPYQYKYLLFLKNIHVPTRNLICVSILSGPNASHCNSQSRSQSLSKLIYTNKDCMILHVVMLESRVRYLVLFIITCTS